jgi:hypothetical protein
MSKALQRTLAFIVIGVLLLPGGLIVGIDDNLPGLLMIYGAIACFILAVAHRWQRPRSFFLLFGLSVLGFLVFAVLHNLLHAVGKSSSVAWIKAVMEVLGTGSFFVPVLICPPAFLVGLIGYFVAGFRELGRRPRRQPS